MEFGICPVEARKKLTGLFPAGQKQDQKCLSYQAVTLAA